MVRYEYFFMNMIAVTLLDTSVANESKSVSSGFISEDEKVCTLLFQSGGHWFPSMVPQTSGTQTRGA